MDSDVIDRGQTALGSLFTLVIIVLVFSGTITVAYGYINSPALDSSDTSSEASIIANHLIYDTLSSDGAVESSQTQTLSYSKSKKFFIKDNTTLVSEAENHNVAQAENLYVNVSIKNATSTTQNDLFIYDNNVADTTAGDDPSKINPSQPNLFKSRGGYSSYQQIVLIDGEIAVLEVRTWK